MGRKLQYGRIPLWRSSKSILQANHRYASNRKILLPADGEGRNGVYATTRGWSVDAFDQSQQAKEKALRLAKRIA